MGTVPGFREAWANRERARPFDGNIHVARGPMKDGMTPPTMGITHARVVLHSIDMARNEACDLLVDTGSTLSWVPEDVAARIGIQATEVRTFRLADGRGSTDRSERPSSSARDCGARRGSCSLDPGT